MNKFVALDFETANKSRASACSIGMVKIDGQHMTEEFYTLINPETHFSEGNIRVHGITHDDTKQSPIFSEVFPYMMDFIGDYPVVAHNARFDMNVLYHSLLKYELDIPEMTYFDSVLLARQTIKNDSYSLDNLMRYYNITFNNHHNALADAKACAMITYRLLKSYSSLDDYLNFNKKYLHRLKY